MTADEWLDSVIACYKGRCEDCDPCLSLQCSGHSNLDMCYEILRAADEAGVVARSADGGWVRLEGER